MLFRSYLNLVAGFSSTAPESVHLCDYPVCEERWIDAGLERAMDEVLKIVVAGRACRNNAAIKNRQPLGRMFVKTAAAQLSEEYSTIILEELNVKDILFTQDVREFTTYTFKPQLRTVGPKYGKLVGQIRQALTEVDGNEAMDALRNTQQLCLDISGTQVVLGEEDLLIESAQKPGFMAETEGDLTVVLDTNLTEELLEEGFVREVISKVQTMRKEAGFEVTDHIEFFYSGSGKAERIIRDNEEKIAPEVLADRIAGAEADQEAYTKEWNVNGEPVVFAVKKAE